MFAKITAIECHQALSPESCYKGQLTTSIKWLVALSVPCNSWLFFARIRGAQGFQQSNPSVLATVSVLGSLEVFKKAGWMKPLRARSLRLTGYLEALLHASRFYVPVEQASKYSQSAANSVGVTIITPANPDDRGAQLSLVFLPTGRGVMPRVLKELGDRGVVGDSRKPDVIRIAPCPLYNTFEDVERSVRMLEEALETVEVSGLGGSQ